jgi:dTDP-4-dehydrorhamnose reductase
LTFFRDRLPVFVYISSDLVFDGDDAPPGGFTEGMIPHPVSIYGQNKLEAERIVLSRIPNAVVLRLSLVYGPRVGQHEGFMGWLRGGLEAGEDVPLFADEFRTPVYSADFVRGFLAAVSLAILRREEVLGCGVGAPVSPEEMPGSLLHLAGPERISRYDFGLRVAEIYNFNPERVVHTVQAAADELGPRPKNVSLAIERARKEIGFAPLGVTDGLRALAAS